jgi:bis(5'-nucleosyl)-tetraphosphatase (symmetrical)
LANYIVGDIQGCCDELLRLLDRVKFSPSEDTLWLAGDLVARGPKSLQTLELIISLGNAAKTVLGNHDLHLLAVSLGLFPAKKKDKTLPIIESEKITEFVDWIRHQPLLLEHEDFVLTHAGISPQWDLQTARTSAKEIETILKSDSWDWLIKNMYSNLPNKWNPKLEGLERYRYIINVFTRMRYCYADASLDMACKLPPSEVTDNHLLPWFKAPNRLPIEKSVIFGHWAALDGYFEDNLIGLDTGCVWGGQLTMLDWEKQRTISQPSLAK